MPLQRVTAPSVEPVSLNEAKLNSKIDITDDDAIVMSLIMNAREYAEMLTGRSFITTRWKLVLDAFPGPSLMGVPMGRSFSIPEHAILLPKSPVSQIVSIQYLDMSGILQTMPATDYVADLASEPTRITPVFGKIWPITLLQIGAVSVTFDAGYGPDATYVPEGIKGWIKMRVTSIYDNRSEVVVMPRGKIEPLPFVDGLLDPYRVAWL
jgi:uncharacterized phiE125 gp8 family phage protein